MRVIQTRDETSKQYDEYKKSAEKQWTAAQKQYQKASPSNQKASKKAWNLAEKARDEVNGCKVFVSPATTGSVLHISVSALLLLSVNTVLVAGCALIVPCNGKSNAVGIPGKTSNGDFLPFIDWREFAQANKRLSGAEKELAKAFEHARNTAERRSSKQEL